MDTTKEVKPHAHGNIDRIQKKEMRREEEDVADKRPRKIVEYSIHYDKAAEFMFTKSRYKCGPFEFMVDPENNPVAWVNELFQSGEMLTHHRLGPVYKFVQIQGPTDPCFQRKTGCELIVIQKLDNTTICEKRFRDIDETYNQAKRNVSYNFYKWLHQTPAQVQMDSTQSTIQGIENNEETRAENTTITRAAPQETTLDLTDKGILLQAICSSEDIHSFEGLTNRWIELDHFDFNVTDTFGMLKKTYTLPEAFYANSTAPMKLPFETFALGKFDLEISFKTNGNKFVIGRAIVSYINQYKFISGTDAITNASPYMDIRQAIQRDHVFIDFNESNEATLVLPYYANSPFIGTLKSNSTNITSGASATVSLHILSPLRVVEGAPTTIPCTVFVRLLPSSHFAGMRYLIEPASVQMGNSQSVLDGCKNINSALANIPIIGGVIKGGTAMLGHLAVGTSRLFHDRKWVEDFENRLKYVGVLNNRDKPLDFRQPGMIRPVAVNNMSIGVGPESLKTMRLDPTSTTTTLQSHLPGGVIDDLKEIMRIWGLVSVVSWNKNTNPTGHLLFRKEIFPIPTDETTDEGLPTVLTPLQYLSLMYQAYAGTLEFRFDIICSQFHVGLLKVVYVPFSLEPTYAQTQASYFKIFDLREKKSFTFEVPYINHTVLRYLPNSGSVENNRQFTNATTPMPLTKPPVPGSISLYVVNPLSPIQNVSDICDIAIYHRAGPDFRFAYPVAPRCFVDTAYEKQYLQYGLSPPVIEPPALVQMDTGEKETIHDPRTSGTVIPVATTIQCLESFESISDLSRRYMYSPNVYCAKILEKSSTSNNWVVHTENDHDYDILNVTFPWAPAARFDDNGVYTPRQQTLTTHIMDMFRWHRGSFRYLIDFQSLWLDTNIADIVISYLPPSLSSNFLSDTDNRPVTYIDNHNKYYQGFGLPLQKVVRSVNPVEAIEIPFYKVFNYYDFNAMLSPSLPEYDRVSAYGGQIVIEYHYLTPIAPRTVPQCRAYVSLGDDWNMIKFLGVPRVILLAKFKEEVERHTLDSHELIPQSRHVSTVRINRNPLAHVQMDVKESIVEKTYDPVNGIITEGIMKQYTEPTEEQIPSTRPLGLGQRMKDFISSASHPVVSRVASVSQTVRNFGHLSEKMNGLSERVTKAMDKGEDLMETLKNIAVSMTDQIKRAFKKLVDYSAVFQAILHFLQIVINPTKLTVITALVGIFSSIGLLTVEYSLKFIEYFQTHWRTPEEHPIGDAMVQCSHPSCTNCQSECDPSCSKCQALGTFGYRDVANLCALAMGAVSAYLGLKTSPSTAGLSTGLFRGMVSFWTTISHASRWFTDMIALFSRCFKACLGKIRGYREVKVLNSSSDPLKEFIKEAQICLSVLNQEAFNDPRFKYRFWYTYVTALKYQIEFSTRQTSISGYILRICSDVIKKANEVAIQHMACPVRYEPFVLSLSGQSALGKSHLLNNILPDLLADERTYNLRYFGNPVFTRTNGVEFWNGYVNQPCVLYDDFLAVLAPEIAATQVIELYNLKSSAVMNMNMAAIDEKNMRGNPFIVALACNSPHTVVNGTVCPEAFLRRKDSSWHVQLCCQDKPRTEYTEEEQKNYDYLVFYKYKNPGLIEDPDWTRKYSYAEFKEELIKETSFYHKNEQKNVQSRMDKLQVLLPNTLQVMTEGVDPFLAFYKACTESAEQSPVQTGLLPSEVVTHSLQDIKNSITAYVQMDNVHLYTAQELFRANCNLCNLADVHNVGFHPHTPACKQIYDQDITNIGDAVDSPRIENRVEWRNPIEILGLDIGDIEVTASFRLTFKEKYTKIVEYIRSIVFEKSVSRIFSPPPVQVECPICRGIKAPHARCENAHWVCEHCYDAIETEAMTHHANGGPLIVRCPMCRSPTQHEYQDVRVSELEEFVAWKYVKDLPSKVRNYIRNQDFSNPITIVKWYIGVVSFIVYASTLIESGFMCLKRSEMYNTWSEADGYTERFQPVITGPIPIYKVGVKGENNPWMSWKYSDYSLLPHKNYAIFDKLVGEVQSDTVSTFKPRNKEEWILDFPQPGERISPMLVRDERKSGIDQYVRTIGKKTCHDNKCCHATPEFFDVNVYWDMDAKKWILDLAGNVSIDDLECEYIGSDGKKGFCIFGNKHSRARFLNLFALSRQLDIEYELRNFDEMQRMGEMWRMPMEYVSPLLHDQIEDAYADIRKKVEEASALNEWQIVKKFGRNMISTAWTSMKRIIKIGLLIASAIGTVVGCCRLFRSFYRDTEVVEQQEQDFIEPQLAPNYSYNNKKLAAAKKPIRTIRPTATTQSGGNMRNIALKRLESNTIFIECAAGFKKGERPLCVRAMGLYGFVCMLTSHEGRIILKRQKEYEQKGINFECIAYRHENRELICTITDFSKFVFIDERELCILELPKRMPMFRDILSLIPTIEQHRKITAEIEVMCVAKGDVKTIVCKECQVLCMQDSIRLVATEEIHGEIYDNVASEGYITSIEQPGLCGAIYFHNTQTPFFAIHVGGYTKSAGNSVSRGIGIPLVREELQALQDKTLPCSYFIPTLEEDIYAKVQLGGHITQLGKASRGKIPHMPEKTKILPSLINGKIYGIEVKTAPCILSSRDPRYIGLNLDKSPLYYGCIKHTRPPRAFDPIKLNLVLEDLKNLLITKCKPCRILDTPLTMREIVCGIDGLPYYDGIDMGTSSGWPWNTTNKKTKDAWITVERNSNSEIIKFEIDDELLRVIQVKEKMRSTGVKPFTVFLDWLKDERRKIEKLEKPGGTRIFSLSPIDYLITTRKYFLDFSAAYTSSRLDVESGVGINADSNEWTELVGKLVNVGSKIVTGDYSDFGPTLQPEVIEGVGRNINEWYRVHSSINNSKLDLQRTMHIEEAVRSVHLCYDLFYETYSGSPSGHPLTVIINTEVNKSYIRYAWLDIFWGTQHGNLDSFNRNVAFVAYGDDFIMSVSPNFINEFNCLTIAKVLRRYDIVLSDASKVGTIPYQSLHKSSFLKQGFLNHPKRPGKFLAPLEETSIHESAQWIWQSHDAKEATRVNAEASIRNAYGHGPKYFKNWQKLVNEALVKHKITPVSLSWDEIDLANFGIPVVEGEFKPISFDGVRPNKTIRLKDNPSFEKLTPNTWDDEGSTSRESVENSVTLCDEGSTANSDLVSRIISEREKEEVDRLGRRYLCQSEEGRGLSGAHNLTESVGSLGSRERPIYLINSIDGSVGGDAGVDPSPSGKRV